MRIPKQVKIGGFTYNVERPDVPFVSDGIAADGEHCFANKTIKVASNGCPEYQDLVFLHEVCHAIISCYVADRQDEEFVEQFSKGLYQFLVDNPDVVAERARHIESASPPYEGGIASDINRCVVCGEEIPEGWQVCPECEKGGETDA